MKRRLISVLLVGLGVGAPVVVSANPDKAPKAKDKTPKAEVSDDGDDHDMPDADDDDDEHEAGGGPSHLKVSGAVTFRFEVLSGDIDAVAGAGNEVDISSPHCAAGQLHLSQSGTEVEAEMDNPLACVGPFNIKLPTGSEAELKSTSGNITLKGKFGDIEIEAVSGDINIEKAADIEVNAVNGKVKIGDAAGKVNVETVRGDTEITMSSSSPRFEYEAVSGNLSWTGLCGASCRMEIQSFSGNVNLRFDPRSSFGLKMESQTGQLKDDLGVTVSYTKHRAEGEQKTRASFGKGEGSVECETFSGGVTVGKK